MVLSPPFRTQKAVLMVLADGHAPLMLWSLDRELPGSVEVSPPSDPGTLSGWSHRF